MDVPPRASDVKGGGDHRDMEEWCGLLLEELTGLDGAPAPLRAHSPEAMHAEGMEVEGFHPSTVTETRERSNTLPTEFPAGLGKRARAVTVGAHSPPREEHPAGYGLGLPPPMPDQRMLALAANMGPYRSSSVHSVESTLSGQVDRALGDMDHENDLGHMAAAPPHKKGPLTRPLGAPALSRRAFSEGAAPPLPPADDVSRSGGDGPGAPGSAPDTVAGRMPGIGSAQEPSSHSQEGNDDGSGGDGGDQLSGDDPSVSRAGQKTAPWTRTEDQVISEAVKRFGCKWGVLSALLPGRTDNAVRNRWHRLERARRWREEVASRARAAGMQDPTTVKAPPPGLLPASSRTGVGSGYKCGRCGQLKRGHLCTVTLESDEAVYNQAQGKMRELHLQQIDKRTQHARGRKQAPQDGDAGGQHLPAQSGGQVGAPASNPAYTSQQMAYSHVPPPQQQPSRLEAAPAQRSHTVTPTSLAGDYKAPPAIGYSLQPPSGAVPPSRAQHPHHVAQAAAPAAHHVHYIPAPVHAVAVTPGAVGAPIRSGQAGGSGAWPPHHQAPQPLQHHLTPAARGLAFRAATSAPRQPPASRAPDRATTSTATVRMSTNASVPASSTAHTQQQDLTYPPAAPVGEPMSLDPEMLAIHDEELWQLHQLLQDADASNLAAGLPSPLDSVEPDDYRATKAGHLGFVLGDTSLLPPESPGDSSHIHQLEDVEQSALDRFLTPGVFDPPALDRAVSAPAAPWSRSSPLHNGR